MSNIQISSIEEQSSPAALHFRLQSCINSAARRALFLGRRRVIRALPFSIEKPVKIMEVGCGTGDNLRQLARWFPNSFVIGTDVSSRMLDKAYHTTADFWKRVELIKEPYGAGCMRFKGKLDAILFSYSLSRPGSQWQELASRAREALKPGGFIAVVDFHDSRFTWLKTQLSSHHVRMDGCLLPFLTKEFDCLASETRTAYGGLWEYFHFLGRKG